MLLGHTVSLTKSITASLIGESTPPKDILLHTGHVPQDKKVSETGQMLRYA